MASSRVDFVQELTDGCLIFLERLCDVQLYTYQQEIADRIFFSLLIGDAEEITVESARQIGKSETLADVAATAMVLLPKLALIYPDDEVLRKFRNGLWVGCFGPTELQSDTIYSRIELRLTSEVAKEILSDPEIDDLPMPGGKLLRLRESKSFCRMQTAHPKAKIESKTYHLVLEDEAQDADSTTVRKSIHPMLTATAGTIVKVGTPSAHKSDYYEAIQRNKHRNKTHGKKNHFSIDWKRAAKENPLYEQSIQREKLRLGEDSDEFRMCVAPETRVLTADLRYIPASDVHVGMKLVGFDEYAPKKGQHRKFRETVVEDVAKVIRSSYRLTLSDGTIIVCSAEHPWLVTTAGRRTVWKTTEELNKPRYQDQRFQNDRIFKIVDVWDHVRNYETGYLAAAFDGEGHLSTMNEAGKYQIGFSQLENVMLAKVREYLGDLGIAYSESKQASNGVHRLNITGRAGIMRFLGQVRPIRLLPKFDVNQAGSIGRHDHQKVDFKHPEIIKKDFIGDQEVIAFKTSTKTFVAEGLASHNSYSLAWLLERGMFVTDDQIDELGDKTMQIVQSWGESPIVIGLDVASKHDSTVATAVWVDWERPDEFGLYDHRILNWLQIQGENWESQYRQICDFCSRYYVMRLGVDAQGMGGPVAERLQVLLPNIEVVPLAMNPIDQTERWQHLMQLIQRRLIGWPAHPRTTRLQVYKRFIQQLSEVEKEYKGRYIHVAAPKNERNAHDDFIDSLALACSLTKEFGQNLEVQQWNTNPLMERYSFR